MLYLYKQSNRIIIAMFKGGDRFHMKKSKIALGIVAGLASVTALASCSEVKPVKNEGYLLTYKSPSTGEEVKYSAEELFGTYFKESSSVSSMFDKIYKLIVRNFFNVDKPSLKADIEKNAQLDVDGVKSTANKNAKSNKTSYKEEFEKLLESYSCEDEAELLEHFIYEREETEFEKQFYDHETIFKVNGKVVTGTEWLRDSKVSDGYEGYLEKKAPYHIRHILVKLSGTSDSKKYWDDTIDEKDAKNLHTVASSLAQGDLDFGQVAKNSSEYSDDSASNYGELGIMDKDTSYVNEFKLGIYAYENLYGENIAAAAASEISMTPNTYNDIKGIKGLDIKNGYKTAVKYVYNADTKDMGGDADGSIATIPYGVFEALKDYAVTTHTSSGEVVNENNSAFYPRNVLFNKYLNKHQVAFITPNAIPANGTAGTDHETTPIDAESTLGTLDDGYAAMKGFNFKTVKINGVDTKVLATTNGNPILVVRAGTSDYQGIHFIVIERSPLEKVADLGTYYTTYYPGQAEYDEKVGGKDTYVNFMHQSTAKLKERAEKVSSTIKGFDSSNLKKRIYQAYLKDHNISFNKPTGYEGYDLETVIEDWIKANDVKSEFDTANTWESTWEDYINTLSQQKVERRKLVSEACAIGFTKSNGTKGDNWKEGGICYVPTQK